MVKLNGIINYWLYKNHRILKVLVMERKKMSDKEKLESDKYVLISRNRIYFKDVSVLVAVLGAIIIGVRKVDLTFDSAEQKAIVLEHARNVNTVEVKLIGERQSSMQADIREIKELVKEIKDYDNGK